MDNWSIGIWGLRILILLALAYPGAVVWMWVRKEAYLFVPKHYEILPKFERHRRDQTINGVKLQGWFLDKGAEKTRIYHGGNAEDLASHLHRAL